MKVDETPISAREKSGWNLRHSTTVLKLRRRSYASPVSYSCTHGDCGGFLHNCSGSERGKADKPQHEKREHTVYILDKGFSSNEQGFGTLVLVLDALPGNTNIIRVINKSASPHGFKMEIKNQSFGLDKPVAPGETAQFEFTAPPELRGNNGKFYSPVGDDRKRGFEGRVTLLSEAEGG